MLLSVCYYWDCVVDVVILKAVVYVEGGKRSKEKDKRGKGGMYRRVLRTPDMQINTSR